MQAICCSLEENAAVLPISKIKNSRPIYKRSYHSANQFILLIIPIDASLITEKFTTTIARCKRPERAAVLKKI